ncbi:MAG: hypothetical protein UY22_C0046G0002 [Candidatus Amesbacteria bacterium GW2011_GWC1_48_10]|uniref:Uncharacterized protein n=1 Tax=Candidatus Amesbacteria bacterium GW2011_GWC1_48_10 TaxID=1618365 RepID=A0A0G1UAC4_9BACT|nr:MAG: hypothetical protein UY22_C0046G0002 [Candidatus Amesbacteria bacterium GW2011_GWC1_48_10]
MRLFRREASETEKLFGLFHSDLKRKEFDLMVFDKKQIKKHFGRGLYETWRKSLEALHYRKIIIIFKEKEPKISWPSDNYPDRLVVNMARTPDKEALLGAEEELLGLLELEEEIL